MSADGMLVGGARPFSPMWAMVWERLVALGHTLSANKTERRMVLLQWLVMPLVLAGCLLPIPRHGEQTTHVFAAACVMLAHPLLYMLGGRVSSLRSASRTFALTATDVTVATLVFYTTAARPGYAQVLLYCAVALAATRYAPRRAFGIASLVALLLVFAALLPLHMALPTVASEILGLYALTGLVGLLSEAEKAVGAAAAENAYLARTVLQRNRELAALNRLSHTMNSAAGTEDILRIGLAGMAEVLELRALRAYLIEEGGAPELRLVARMGDDEPTLGVASREEDAHAPADDATKAARSACTVVEGLCLPAGAPVLAWEHVRASVPLLVSGRPVAVIQARLSRPAPATTEAMLETLQIFCGEVALALENALLRGEAHRSAVLREKNRIAQELHDTVLQMLFSIGLRLQWSLDNLVEDDQAPSPLREPLEEARHLSACAGEELRGAIFTLSSDIAEIGLVAAVRRLVDDQAIKAGWSANLVTTGEQPELPVLMQNAAHRVVREALMNAYKHAQATEVMVSVRFTCDMLTIVVQDNGVGVADAALANFRQTPDHFGLRTVAEQIESLGGAFSISSNDDEQGTTVRATVPVDSR